MSNRVKLLVSALAVVVGLNLGVTPGLAGKQATLGKFSKINNSGEISFFVISEGWLDAVAKFEAELAKTVRRIKDQGAPVDEAALREMAKTHERSRFQYALAKEARFAIYRLGITMPKDVKVIFNGAGCLQFEVELPDGRIESVIDQGVICPYEYPPVQTWDDTRKSSVTFTPEFNQGKLGAYPNFVYVLLPRWAMGTTVRQVQPTDKMEIISPHRATMFK